MFASGMRLGPYEIISPIGAGGMGEVYKARDTRLDRTVAVKVLPAELAQSAQFKQRFDREARAISALNHPNICTLHDVGNDNGVDYLVMEYIEGESLADVLARGPMPIDQVLRYGAEIAAALDRAHRAGIVHRDLKPGNIMITRLGAKLLDFGLARSSALTAGLFTSTATAGATEHKPLTAEGTIVGTFQYMAPEQLEGIEADARTDIFAFGAVLYEMATGKRAFEGKTKTSLIAAIIDRDPPPMSQFQPLTPPAFERLVKTCLAKDPDDRWQTMHDILLQLRWIGEAGSQAGVAAPVVLRRKHREWLAWTLGALLLTTAGIFAWLWRRDTAEPLRRIESSIPAPDKNEFLFTLGVPALSPDGTRLAFSARGADGKLQIWIRRLDNGAVQTVQDSALGIGPFWSPDSRFLGFFTSTKLRRVAASGGPSQTICEVKSNPRGGSWSQSGAIVFAATDRSGIYRVPSTGGVPVAVTQLEHGKEYSHRWPSFLPDGDHFLYLAQTFSGPQDRGHVYLGSLSSPKRKLVVSANSAAVYAEGYLLYVRERALVAQRFDLKSLELSEDTTVITDPVSHHTPTPSVGYSASTNGMLVFHRGDAGLSSQLSWRDRSGALIGTIGTPGDYQRPSIAHDGRRIAYEVIDASGNGDIWIYDQIRQTATRFTFGDESESNAVWSKDDHSIAYVEEKLRESERRIMRKTAAGTEEGEVLARSDAPFIALTDWSPDGRYLFYGHSPSTSKTAADLYLYSFAEKKSQLVVQTPFNDCCARLSPDGRWLAYGTNETGRGEVYVQSFPQASARWQISSNGGTQPRWRQDSRELFYYGTDNKIMSVEIGPGPAFDAGVPKELFGIRAKQGGWPYDVTPDGQRFLMNDPTRDASTIPLTLVVNWTAELP